MTLERSMNGTSSEEVRSSSGAVILVSPIRIDQP
jgi:hypothetical protein